MTPIARARLAYSVLLSWLGSAVTVGSWACANKVVTGQDIALIGSCCDALRRQVEHDRWLRGIDEFIRAFEAEHGEITEAEMNEVARDIQLPHIEIAPLDGDLAKRAGLLLIEARGSDVIDVLAAASEIHVEIVPV
jgi:hypothetical protein